MQFEKIKSILEDFGIRHTTSWDNKIHLLRTCFSSATPALLTFHLDF